MPIGKFIQAVKVMCYKEIARIVSILVCVCVSVVFCGCSYGNDQQAADSSKQEATKEDIVDESKGSVPLIKLPTEVVGGADIQDGDGAAEKTASYDGGTVEGVNLLRSELREVYARHDNRFNALNERWSEVVRARKANQDEDQEWVNSMAVAQELQLKIDALKADFQSVLSSISFPMTEMDITDIRRSARKIENQLASQISAYDSLVGKWDDER